MDPGAQRVKQELGLSLCQPISLTFLCFFLKQANLKYGLLVSCSYPHGLVIVVERVFFFFKALIGQV